MASTTARAIRMPEPADETPFLGFLFQPYVVLYGGFLAIMVAISFDIPALSERAYRCRWFVLGLFAFLGSWNGLLWPLMVTQREEMRTIEVGLQNFLQAEGTYPHLLMAASTLAVLPRMPARVAWMSSCCCIGIGLLRPWRATRRACLCSVILCRKAGPCQ